MSTSYILSNTLSNVNPYAANAYTTYLYNSNGEAVGRFTPSWAMPPNEFEKHISKNKYNNKYKRAKFDSGSRFDYGLRYL